MGNTTHHPETFAVERNQARTPKTPGQDLPLFPRLAHVRIVQDKSMGKNHYYFSAIAATSATQHRDMSVDVKLGLFSVMVVAIMLVGVVRAGYVGFYRDADFQNKITTVKPVQVDTCYNLGCFGLDDAVTSAKWGDLPETNSGDGSITIAFYTARGCTAKHKSWPVRVESDSNLHFPRDFKLDGINDAISSFMVVKEGDTDNEEYVCSESNTVSPTNTSVDTDRREQSTLQY